MALPSTCSTAVIAVAGFGTRRLPITKATEKSMLPIGNRPIIDYIVDDCIAAGITNIIFIVGEQSQQLRIYYGQNQLLESYLADIGKQAMLDEVRAINSKASFQFITQDSTQPYGTSTPIWLAKDLLQGEESFLYLYGDNIFYNADGSSAVKAFTSSAIEQGKDGAMMAIEVPLEDVSHYGIVATTQQDGLEMYQHIVEKPKLEDAPSNLNNAGCFMLKPDIFPYIERSITDSPQNEKYVIDALNWYVEDGRQVSVIRSNAQFLDCGNVEGWLHANNLILGRSS